MEYEYSKLSNIETNNVKRALLYYRVSTKMQEEKYSLSAQKRELRKYAEMKEWHVVAEHQDVESGGKLDKVGLNALLDDVEDGKADVVLVIDQDRLSRLDNTDWNTLKTILRQNNVDIASPGSYTNLKDEDNVFVADLMNLLAQREKAKIVRRMMRGKEQRTREGKGWGVVPLGYKLKESGVYEIDEAWAWVIEFIDTKYLAGMSAAKIADELNSITRTPSGAYWSPNSILDKLKNPAYAGKFIRRFKHNGAVVEVDNVFPRLRSETRVKQLQKRLSANGARKPREYNTEFASLKVTCGKCGKTLRVNKNSANGKDYFTLTHSRVRLPDDPYPRKRCDMSINVERYEANVRSALKKVLMGPAFAAEHLELDDNASELENISKELKTINSQLQGFEKQRKNVISLVRKGLIDMDEAEDELKVAEDERSRLETRERGLQGKYELLKQGQYTYDVVQQYLTILWDYDLLMEVADQQDLIHDVFPSATVAADASLITLHGALPNGAPLDVNVPIGKPLNESRLEAIHERQRAEYEKIKNYYIRHEAITSVSQLASETGVHRSVLNDYRKKFGELPGLADRADRQAKKDKLRVVKNIIDYKLQHPEATYTDMQRELAESENRVKKAMRHMKDSALMEIFKTL